MASKKKAANDKTPAAPEVAPGTPVVKAAAPKAAPKPAGAKPAVTKPEASVKSPSGKPAAKPTAASPKVAPAKAADVTSVVPLSSAAKSAKPSAAKAPKAEPLKADAPVAAPAAAPKKLVKPAAKPTSAPKQAASPKVAAPKVAAPKVAAPKATPAIVAVAKAAVTKAADTPGSAAKAPKAKAPAPKAPVSKAPIRARAAGGGSDDFGDPDDDDIDDDEDDVKPPAVLVDEEDEPTAVAVADPEEESQGEAVARPAKRLTPRPVPPMPPRKPGVITVALSPDADDAFMLYALAHGKIDTEGRQYEFVRGDIAALNDEAKIGTHDVTAFSFGAWPQVVERYLALPCGASFGDGVGPVVVSKTLVRPNEVNGLLVGVPGLSTTAALVLRLWLAPARLKLVSLPFQDVIGAVKEGKVRAGVLIHEAQLTYRLDGLTKVMDLGRWWTDKTEGLPLPLGGTAIRRDIPAEERTKIALDLKRSIAYAMGHREEALEHAAKFSKGLPRQLLDRYITMYVNELTLDIGERGRQAVHTLFDYAVRMGTMKERVDLELS